MALRNDRGVPTRFAVGTLVAGSLRIVFEAPVAANDAYCAARESADRKHRYQKLLDDHAIHCESPFHRVSFV